MKYQPRGVQISLIIHGILFALLIFLGNSMVPEKKPLVIDFTMEEPRGAGEKKLFAKAEPGQKKVEEPKRELKTSPLPEVSVKPEQRAVSECPSPVTAPLTLPAPVAARAGSSSGSVTGVREAGKTDGAVSGKGLGERADSRTVAREGYGGEAAKKQYLREHFTYIRDLIMKNLLYPVMARKMGWEGKVMISFVVCENGRVEEIRVVETSGISILDRSAVECVKTCGPFPKPPVRAELVLPIVFKLK